MSIEGEMLSVSCTKLSLRKKRGRKRMRRRMVHRRMPLPKATRAILGMPRRSAPKRAEKKGKRAKQLVTQVTHLAAMP